MTTAAFQRNRRSSSAGSDTAGAVLSPPADAPPPQSSLETTRKPATRQRTELITAPNGTTHSRYESTKSRFHKVAFELYEETKHQRGAGFDPGQRDPARRSFTCPSRNHPPPLPRGYGLTPATVGEAGRADINTEGKPAAAHLCSRRQRNLPVSGTSGSVAG